MDSIPNKVLVQIIGCLRKQEILKMRLVSIRFNLVATTYVQKLCEVRFNKDSDIEKFVTMFENKAIVPYEKFWFSMCPLLSYGPALEQFCVQFGKFVTYWSVILCNRAEHAQEYSLSKNLQILLENCVNVEKINFSIGSEGIGKPTNIPVLRNLNTVTVLWFHVGNKDFLSLLHRIIQKAPNFRGVIIYALEVDRYSHLETATNILHQLHNMNEAVRIRKLYMHLWLPATNVDDFENFVAISTQFGIDDLDLSITVGDHYPERLPQTLDIFSKWIQQLRPVGKLSLRYSDLRNRNDRDRPHVPIAIPLHSLVNLECLEVWRPFPVVPSRKMEFPVLTDLRCKQCYILRHNNNFNFSGCYFPSVKYAEIRLITEKECEQWPMVLPNVEKLSIDTETLNGLFRFPKLRKLRISIDSRLNADEESKAHIKHWNYLTGGAEYISDTEIWSFPVQTPMTSDSIDSFRNLPLLTHLTISGRSIECRKGIIYASRTGQLGRLQQLVLSPTPKDFTMEELYNAVLMQYHDTVSIRRY